MTMAGLTKATGTRKLLVAAVFGLTLLSACGDSNNSSALRAPGALEGFSPEQIYQLGEEGLSKNRASDAAFYFGEIERLYPYSDWAKRGLIMQAYAYHQDKDFENSRASAQRFVDFYPTDNDAAYAQYLLALSYYDQIDDIGRDQGLTFQALQSLRTVIESYPETDYASQSVLKFDLAFDHLAGKEMEVGRYYLKGRHYTAAANRFRVVVESFQTTTHTPEALMRLVESYLALGLDEEAQTAGAILGHNYAASEWYKEAYAKLQSKGLEPRSAGDNWLTAIYRQVIRGEWM